MPDMPHRTLAAWAAGLVAIAALGLFVLRRDGPGEAGAAARNAVPIRLDDASGGGGGSRVFVHVAGAVEKAGGARRTADLGAVNLASKLEDGRQVLVPRRVGAGAAAASAAIPGAPAAPGAPAVPIDLNTATLEQLDTLDGVGPVTAQKILDYRQEHGGFGSIDELGQVPGIGPKTMEALREKVRV